MQTIEFNTKESADIRLLKMRLRLLVQNENYEIAERIKNWIIELGGNPSINC